MTDKSVHAGGIQGQVMKTKAFMKQHADMTTTLTKSGYNPLLEDFSNTSFYIGSAGVYAMVQCSVNSYMCLEGCNLYTEHFTAQLAICVVNRDTGDRHFCDSTCYVSCRVMLTVMSAVGIRAASDALLQQRTAS